MYNKEGFLELGVSPEQAPDKPTYVTIHFEKGIPTAIDGVEMGAVELVKKLNELGGANGIGVVDLVENRLVGMKSRGVYETPGGQFFTTHTTSLRSLLLIEIHITTSRMLHFVLQNLFISVSGIHHLERLFQLLLIQHKSR